MFFGGLGFRFLFLGAPRPIKSLGTGANDTKPSLETPPALPAQALANVKPDSDIFPDFTVADVVTRTVFRSSPLYGSFVAARVLATLELARRATGEQRMKLLEQCGEFPAMSTGVAATLADASTLFDVRLPLLHRVKHLVAVPMSKALARDWDGDGLSRYLQPMPLLGLFKFSTGMVNSMSEVLGVLAAPRVHEAVPRGGGFASHFLGGPLVPNGRPDPPHKSVMQLIFRC